MRSSAGASVPRGRGGRCHLTGKGGRVLGTGAPGGTRGGGHKERSAQELHFLPFSLIWMAAEKPFLRSWVSELVTAVWLQGESEGALVLSRCGWRVRMQGVGTLQPTSKSFSKKHYKYAYVPWGCGAERAYEQCVCVCVCVCVYCTPCGCWTWGACGAVCVRVRCVGAGHRGAGWTPP